MSEKAPRLHYPQKLFERAHAFDTRFENRDVTAEKGFEVFSLNDFSHDGRKVDTAILNAGAQPKNAPHKKQPKGRIGGREKGKMAAFAVLGGIVAALTLSFLIPGLRELVWGWLAAKDLWIIPASFVVSIVLSIIGLIGLYAWDKKFNDPNQIKKANKNARKRKD